MIVFKRTLYFIVGTERKHLKVKAYNKVTKKVASMNMTIQRWEASAKNGVPPKGGEWSTFAEIGRRLGAVISDDKAISMAKSWKAKPKAKPQPKPKAKPQPKPKAKPQPKPKAKPQVRVSMAELIAPTRTKRSIRTYESETGFRSTNVRRGDKWVKPSAEKPLVRNRGAKTRGGTTRFTVAHDAMVTYEYEQPFGTIGWV